ncbi:MAG: peptidase S10 [Pseudomonadota bacterium]
MPNLRERLSVLPCTVLLAGVLLASAGNAESESSDPAVFRSEHQLRTASGTVRYEAVAGESVLRDEGGNPTAYMWSTAYRGIGFPAAKRPVVFAFSGGPGAPAARLNLGFLGPKIVRIDGVPSADDGAAPFKLADNPLSPLDIADFVFVDPIGTGYSRAVGSSKDVDFWNMSADAKSMADFIFQWVTENKRWDSPKYLLGLSYGTTRAVAVAAKLAQSPYYLAMNGLVLHGPALDFIGLDPLTGNPLSYVGFFPTMAAIAHYHGKAGVGEPLEEFLAEARIFAHTDYFAALLAGSSATSQQQQIVAAKASEFIGLDAQYILNERLRVPVARFRKELLRDQGLTLGYSDGGYTALSVDMNASEPRSGDPSDYREDHSYGAGHAKHLSADLGVEITRPYHWWNPAVGRDWQWTPVLGAFSSAQAYRQAKRTGRIEVASQLASTLRENQDLRVQVGVGYYDLFTPFYDAERVFANFGIDNSRVEMNYYESGHRIWSRDEPREKLVGDLRRFILRPSE